MQSHAPWELLLLLLVIALAQAQSTPEITTANGSLVLVPVIGGSVAIRTAEGDRTVALADDVQTVTTLTATLSTNADAISASLDELDASTASISAGVSGSVRDLSAAVTALSQDKAERVYVDDNLALKVDTDRFDSLSGAVASGQDSLSSAIESLDDSKANRDDVAAAFEQHVTNDRFDGLSQSLSSFVTQTTDQFSSVENGKATKDELATELAKKASNDRVDALEDALTLAWPALESFDSESPTGWTDQNSNAYASVTSCGPYGSLLGGFNVAGRGLRLSKTYTLPVHSGVQIEFDYFFIDSWDNEFARVLVDNELQWSRRHNHAGAGKSGQLCGNPASANWGDTVEHVVLRLEEHTARSLRLTVTASLDGLADDESFGISNIRIGPIMPQWPSVALFNKGTPDGWTGSGSGLSDCGLSGVLLGGSSAGAGKDLVRTYEHLPAHNGLRLRFRLFFLDDWPAEASVMVHMDGRLLYKASKPSAAGNLCLENINDAMTLVDITHETHVSSTATVRISTDLKPEDSAAFFGIKDVVLTEPVEAWPALLDFEHSGDRFGWSSDADIRSCGTLGNILGGHNQLGSGEFLERTFYNLPQHDGITLTLRYIFGDTWDNDERGLIYVDGVEIARPLFSDYPAGQYCGRDNADRVADLTLHVPDHSASTLTLRISSTLSSAADDESFAIDDVAIGPFIRTWPPTDTFTEGIDGWQSNANLRTSTCGPLGSILGGANILGRNAVISKKYEHLPDHDGLHITMDAILVDSWDNEEYQIYVDGVPVWSVKADGNKNGQFCGSSRGGWYEARHPVDLILPHKRDSVTILIRTTLNSPPNDESFGVDNVHIGPAPVLTWPLVDNFEGQSTHGWAGYPNNEVTVEKCGAFGNILGRFGAGRYIEKSFGPLPPHSSLRIEMTLYFIDSWDANEKIFIDVDGNNEADVLPGTSVANYCGGGWGEKINFVSITVNNHYASTVTVLVRSNINSNESDESFAIDDVRVMAA